MMAYRLARRVLADLFANKQPWNETQAFCDTLNPNAAACALTLLLSCNCGDVAHEVCMLAGNLLPPGIDGLRSALVHATFPSHRGLFMYETNNPQ